MKKLLFGLGVAALAVACNPKTDEQKAESHNTTTENATKMDNLKNTALEAQDALFKDFSVEGVKKHFKPNYIQHNPGVPTGLEPILGFVEPLKASGISVKTHRVLQDGEFVVLHNEYHNAQAFGAEKLASFDVWRMEDGQVAEHWDNLTPVTPPNPSGRTQFDGTTEITDTDKTDANKATIKAFITDVLLNHKADKVTDYISTEEYLQHNSQVADGLEGFGAAMKFFAENNMVMDYTKLHKVIGEGNFVLAMSEGKFGPAPGTHSAFYDLFRLKDGKIVEHWDVISEIPAEMKHNNGKF